MILATMFTFFTGIVILNTLVLLIIRTSKDSKFSSMNYFLMQLAFAGEYQQIAATMLPDQ